jgi:hypothetical protein
MCIFCGCQLGICAQLSSLRTKVMILA